LKTGPSKPGAVKRVGLFGGTFDPVHQGHLIIAEFLREKASLNRIVFVPSAHPPHKYSEQMFDAPRRYAMLEKAVSGNPCFFVSDIEMKRGGPSYTIDTIREMKASLGEETEILFIVGRDNLGEIETWKEPQRIVSECRLLVADRICDSPFDIPGWLKGQFELVKSPLIQISSTDIRRRILEGRSIRYLVPDAILNMIESSRASIR